MLDRSPGARGEQDSYGGYRQRLVEALQAGGVKDLHVLRAIATVPRHLFVPEALRGQAYEDSSLPIGNGQTISAPSTHARAIQALRLQGTERVLEIGTGTGYQTALLAMCADQVFSVERLPALAEQARKNLGAAGVRNASVLVGDGTLGWRAYGPYQAMIVAAASPDLPGPLVEQLAPEGRVVIPLGDKGRQVLTLVTRNPAGEFHRSPLVDASFVPLRGTHGFEG